MSKYYRVTIDEIDEETGEEKQIDSEEYKGFTLLADCHNDPGKMCETVINDNLIGIAMKLATGSKSRLAVEMASSLIRIQNMKEKDEAFSMESLLRGMIGNDIQ